MRRLAALLVAGLCLALAPATVTVKVLPRFHSAPSTVHITVRIEPDKDNRWLQLTADCPGGPYRSTGYELAGVEAPTMHQVTWPNLPSCRTDYTLTASVAKSTGKVATATAAFASMGDDYSSGEPP